MTIAEVRTRDGLIISQFRNVGVYPFSIIKGMPIEVYTEHETSLGGIVPTVNTAYVLLSDEED